MRQGLGRIFLDDAEFVKKGKEAFYGILMLPQAAAADGRSENLQPVLQVFSLGVNWVYMTGSLGKIAERNDA